MQRFKVRGSWPFPFDMLRYDMCFPATEDDSEKMSHLCNHRTGVDIVELELMTTSLAPPARSRWTRFMWQVIPAAVFVIVLAPAAHPQTVTTSCYRSAGVHTCTTRYLPSVNAGSSITRIAPLQSETADDRAAREDREAKWADFCKPTIVQGADGIGRYVYAKPGCENGRTQ